jgi:hypothetical protein
MHERFFQLSKIGCSFLVTAMHVKRKNIRGRRHAERWGKRRPIIGGQNFGSLKRNSMSPQICMNLDKKCKMQVIHL